MREYGEIRAPQRAVDLLAGGVGDRLGAVDLGRGKYLSISYDPPYSPP
jgi:hypothetical protein